MNKVRRLTATPSQAAMSDAVLQEYINDFYNNDFSYAIKLDQTKSVYTLFTAPFIDRYPLDINNNQGIRSPVYFEGVRGYFYKDRDSFYNMWPRWPSQYQPINGDGTKTSFTFSVKGPFLSTMVVLGGIDATGAIIKVVDDGGQDTRVGNLLLLVSDSVGNYTPPIPATSPIPSGTPSNSIGTVDYVTGAFSINFPVAPAAGSQVTLWVSQYQAARPYSILFWNNEFQIRPVPDNVYKVELESYLTPTQFLATSDNPQLKQWWSYLAYGTSAEIMRDRQDMEGLENIKEGMARQEALVLERQGIEEIGQRNKTIFSDSAQQPGWNQGMGWPY